jgi:hypothetical protein
LVVRRGADGALEIVEITATDGWTSDQQSPSHDQLEVTFRRPGSTVEVSIGLTSSGITSSTQSVSTG